MNLKTKNKYNHLYLVFFIGILLLPRISSVFTDPVDLEFY